jgi:hypothetical protein
MPRLTAIRQDLKSGGRWSFIVHLHIFGARFSGRMVMEQDAAPKQYAFAAENHKN